MLYILEQVLKTGGISLLEEYEWNGRSYLRVFIVGRRAARGTGREQTRLCR
jgi:hypothetical protein